MLKNTIIILLSIVAVNVYDQSTIKQVITYPDQTINGVEATDVKIFSSIGGTSGTVLVTGCDICPLKLQITGKTTFLFNNKKINNSFLNFIFYL